MRIEAEREDLAATHGLSSEEATSAQAYLSMLWGALAFAAMGAISHWAGKRCDWQIVAVARSSVAALLSLIIALASGVRLVFLKPKLLWVRSLVGSFGVLCAFYALTHLPISTAITLTNTFPVWIALLAWAFLGYRPTASIWIAVATGLAGVVLVQQPYWAGSKAAGLAALGNAIGTSIAMIGLNRLSRVDARAIVTHFSLVSTVCCVAYLLLSKETVHYEALHDGWLIVALIGVGVTGTLGQFGMTRAFALGHPSKVAVVGLSQIVFAFVFDLLIWGHGLDLFTVSGMVLVAAPTAWLLLHTPLRRSASIHTTT